MVNNLLVRCVCHSEWHKNTFLSPCELHGIALSKEPNAGMYCDRKVRTTNAQELKW